MHTWLIQKRKAAQMSQQAVADAAEISKCYYASIKTGTRGKPLSPHIAKRITDVREIDWTLFYADENQTA